MAKNEKYGIQAGLVFDSFEAHVTDRVKRALERENMNLAVILGGSTSILQPLDVSLNKPFKDGVRKRWMEWMANGIHKFTATSGQKKPLEELICLWIADTWREIPTGILSLHFLNAESQTVLMDRKIILCTKQTMNLSMMTLL